ncbi:MAG: uncharacterized protein QOJ12_747 [Thermoleophilales bacterium]|nr:uncharacterized protein [Thermoleophilales bacterium]
MDPVVLLFGLGVGVLVGTTGIGGGSIMTPLLILVLGTKPVVAIGTDLAYAAITKTVGGWRHLRKGTVSLGVSGWLAVGSVPGAIGGVVVLHWLHGFYGESFDNFVLWAVAGALMLCGVATLARALLVRGIEAETDEPVMTRRLKLAAVALGLSIGFVLGVTSAGSGSLIAVGLFLIFHMSPHRVVGTDVFHAAVLLWTASIGHILSGNVDYGLMLNLLAGSIPGVWLGAAWSGRISQPVLRHALGVVLITASFGLMTKAGAPFPTATLVVVPVVLGGAAFVNARRVRRARTSVVEVMA